MPATLVLPCLVKVSRGESCVSEKKTGQMAPRNRFSVWNQNKEERGNCLWNHSREPIAIVTFFRGGGGDGFQAENPDIFLVKIQKIICKAARQFSGTGRDFTKNKHWWFAVSRCVPLAKVEGCWKRRWTKVGNRIISSFQPFPAVKTIGGSTL